MADAVSIVRCAVVLVLVGCSAQPPDPTPSASATPTPAPLATATATVAPASASASAIAAPELSFEVSTYPVPAGSQPHDVAPAADGGVWYTAQATGRLGWLDPATGEVREIPLGPGSAPHGVITGPDGAAWVTDSGLSAIVRVAEDDEVTVYPLDAPDANLNTAAFDGDGILWFTGQGGFYGSVDPGSGAISVFAAPRVTGPYGIAATADGEIWFGSLAGSYLGAIDRATGQVEVIDTPTPGGGARRVWPDAAGRLWVTEWFTGSLAMYEPADGT